MNDCPKCRARMDDTASDGVLYSICPDCSAVWVTEPELHGMIRRRLNRRKIDSIPQSYVETDTEKTELDCPDCPGEHLGGIRLRGVEVERCPGCRGILFDPEELSQYAVRTIRSAEELQRMSTAPQVPVKPGSSGATGKVAGGILFLFEILISLIIS